MAICSSGGSDKSNKQIDLGKSEKLTDKTRRLGRWRFVLRAEISDKYNSQCYILFFLYFSYHSSCRKDQFTVLILKFVPFSHWATCAPEKTYPSRALTSFRPGFLAPYFRTWNIIFEEHLFWFMAYTATRNTTFYKIAKIVRAFWLVKNLWLIVPVNFIL